MGIGIVLIFWALVGGIITGCYVLLKRSAKNDARKNFIMQSGGFIIGGVILTPILFLIIIGVSNSIHSFFPGYLYESKLGYAQVVDITDLEGDVSTFGDSSAMALRFKASKQAVDKILAARFTEIERGRFVNHSAFSGAPNKWHNLADKTTRFYEASAFDESYGSSIAVLSYDESSRYVCFYWLGID